MQKIKKITAIALAIVLSLSITACKNDEIPPEDTGEELTLEATEPPTTKPPETTSPEPTVDWDKTENTPSMLAVTSDEYFEYTYSAELEGLVIDKYTGDNKNVLIPSTIEGEPVMQIAAGAFANNQTLEYIYFPESITRIHGEAFAGCIKLSLAIPERIEILESDFIATSVKNLSFSDNAFGLNNSNKLPFFQALLDDRVQNVKYQGKSYEPEKFGDLYEKITNGNLDDDLATAKNWEYELFETELQYTYELFEVQGIALTKYTATDSRIKLSIPAEIEGKPVVCIGKDASALSGSGVIEIEIPDSIKIINDNAFQGTSGLKTANIPGNVIYIGSNAFRDTGLLELAIPNNVKEIGDGAFQNTSLKEITIPRRLEKLGNNAFADCQRLETAVILNSATVIGDNLFQNSTVKKVTLPDNFTEIKPNMFNNCEKLDTVNIPASVVIINVNAFRNTAISNIELPEGLSEIGNNAFADCRKLTVLNIPTSVTRIGTAVYTGDTVAKYNGESYDSEPESYQALVSAING